MQLFKRKFAIALLMTLVFSSISTSQAFATENIEEKVSDVEIIEEQEVIEKTETLEKEGIKADTSLNEETADTDTEQIIEQRLNYVYVEKPYLETPSVQNIVVSWGDGTENIENMRIVLENSLGVEEEWTSTKDIGKLHLFTKEYDDAVKEEYEVTKVRLIQDGSEQEYILAEINDVSVNFGVNKEYEGYGENIVPLGDENVTNIEENIEATVVNLEENGETEAANNIAEALVVADEELATVPKMTEVRGEERINETVIVLDPGHDATHAGATGNGLREEVLSLKIAQYAKAKLEQWGQARIYMVRGSACPYPGTTSSECNANRVEAAKEQGATIYVSFHLNSSTSSAVSGAEIIHPHTNWKPEIGTEGKNLAQAIQKELVALGLKDRGIYSKATQIDTYPDGSKRDWYQIPRLCKEAGFPGIIIEHAFISNANDANKYLKTEAGLKKLGEADAAGIIKYMENSNRWIMQNGKKYYSVGGKLVKGERRIDGKWYYFDERDGAMVTGWYNLPGKKVYYKPTGEMVYGEYNINGNWYYFQKDTGRMLTGWQNFDGRQLYYKTSGEMVHGEYRIDDKWYYFHEASGAMQTGFVILGDKTVYYAQNGQKVYGEKEIDGVVCQFHKDTGALKYGWASAKNGEKVYLTVGGFARGENQIDGKWYYFHEMTGRMQTGFVNLGNKTVYYAKNGQMVYGKQEIDGIICEFHKDTGALQYGWSSTKTGEKVYLTEGGVAKGQKQIDGEWYLFDEKTGYMQIGFINLDGRKVYYRPSGEMVHGEYRIDGHWYYFHIYNGGMQTGFVNLGSKTVYYAENGQMLYGKQEIDGVEYEFHKDTGALQYGWSNTKSGEKVYLTTGGLAKGEKQIDGEWYLFDEKTGYMQTGFSNLSGRKVYYKPSGEMVHGEYRIDGKWYYFHIYNGGMQTGFIDLPEKTVYYDIDGTMVYGEKRINGKWYYFQKDTGRMERNKTINGHYYNSQGIRQ